MTEQCSLELGGDTFIMTERKEWHKKELKGFCFEIWFKSIQDKGVLFSTADEKLMLMFKNGKFTLIVNKAKITSDIDRQAMPGSWSHVAFSLNPKEKSATLMAGGKVLLHQDDVDFSLKKTGRSSLIVVPQFVGSITEVRFWKRSRGLEEIKASLRVPLSIVNDRSSVVVIDIQKPMNRGQLPPAQDEKAFDFGDVAATVVDNSDWKFEGFGGGWSVSDKPAERLVVESKIDDSAKFDRSNDRQGQPVFDRLFAGHVYADTLISQADNFDSSLALTFSTLSNPNAFIQRLSSCFIAAVKRCRSFYLRDEFQASMDPFDRLFEGLRQVTVPNIAMGCDSTIPHPRSHGKTQNSGQEIRPIQDLADDCSQHSRKTCS